MKRLSIVIITWNGDALTMRCLDSLSSLIGRDDVEVIVVDNGSSYSPIPRIRNKYPTCKCIQLPQNLGVGRGRNAGIREAEGKEVLVLDNDIIANPDAILKLLEYKEANPEIGLLAPRLVSPLGDIQQSNKDFPGLGVKFRNVFLGNNDIAKSDVGVEDSEPFYVIGASQMYSRRLWEEIGGYDDKIFYGPEDADFCMAVRAHGKKVVYHPAVTFTHDWQRATRRSPFSALAFKHLAALIYFYRKHHRCF